jgi:predicted ATPase
MLHRPRMFLTRAAVAAFFALAAGPTLAAPAETNPGNHWKIQAEDVAQSLTTAEDIFAKGDVAAAKRSLTESYFHHFEDSKLEAAIRRFIGAKRATEIEKMFSDMRKAMTANNADEVKRLGKAMRDAVAVDAKTLDAEKVAPGVFEVNQ